MKKILVVDDEADVRELLEFNLRAAGFEVILAESGITGLNRARLDSPTLIVLDLMLGDMDGFTVCELLRRQSSTSDIPVIMLTALSGDIPRLNGLAAGACEFLSKTTSPRQWIKTVKGVLRQERARLEEMEAEVSRRND